MQAAMILYDLKCSQNHAFEAWFKDSATFDAQAAAGDVTCPLCGDGDVHKALMAPKIGKRREAEERPGAEVVPVQESRDVGREESGQVRADVPEPQGARGEVLAAAQAELMQTLRRVRREIEEKCDPVGDRFAEEARKIHYGEVEARGIYGQATREEAEELVEEGVEIAAVPWLPREDG